MSRIRGKTEDLAEGVAKLRRGQTAGFDEEVGQMLAGGRALPDRSKQSRKSYHFLVSLNLMGVVIATGNKSSKLINLTAFKNLKTGKNIPWRRANSGSLSRR